MREEGGEGRGGREEEEGKRKEEKGKEILEVDFGRAYSDQGINPGTSFIFSFFFFLRGIHSLNNLNISPTFQYSVPSSGYWRGLFSANSCSV